MAAPYPGDTHHGRISALSDDEGHPVVSGLAALVGVGVVVGLLVSGGALAASSMLGLNGDGDGGTASSQQSMYLPKPSDTALEDGPQITLQPGEQTPSGARASSEAVPQFAISLSSAATEVGPMEEIYLTGVYPGGEGAVVQVQRFENGEWNDFATVDAVVSGETFATYVQTAQSGMNKFRVRDTDGARGVQRGPSEGALSEAKRTFDEEASKPRPAVVAFSPARGHPCG